MEGPKNDLAHHSLPRDIVLNISEVLRDIVGESVKSASVDNSNQVQYPIPEAQHMEAKADAATVLTNTDKTAKTGKTEEVVVDCEQDVSVDLIIFEDLEESVSDALERVVGSAVDKSCSKDEHKTEPIGCAGLTSLSRLEYITDPGVAPEANIFDSHCHLDRVLMHVERVDPDAFEKFIKRNYNNFGAMFEGCITVFCNPSEWDLEEEKLNFIGDPRIWVTFGCHPRFAPYFGPKEEAKLRKMLKATMPKLAALGEIGLDAVHARAGRSSMDVQRKVFLKQIDIAREMKLPICMHVREAAEIAMEVLKESGLPRDWPIHMHCFNDKWDVCDQWMTDWPKMKFGFTPDYCDAEVILRIPLDRLLCETDAPYFKPYVERRSGGRGCQSHPGFVFHVAAQIAAKRKISLGQVLEVSRSNVREVYGI